MDSNSIKFLQDLMRYAGQSASAMSALQQWMEKGNAATSDIGKIFMQAYGIDQKAQNAEEAKKMYHEALDSFQQTMQLLMANMGMVPRSTHLELVRKYEALKERVKDQEETIKHLKALLDEKQGSFSSSQTEAFEKLMKDQQEQFGKFMNSFMPSGVSDPDPD